MAYERSIKFAVDKLTGEIVEADDIFQSKKDGFQVRKEFHMDKTELYCCECEQKLNVSSSKFDRLHFKHQPKANPCILKDGAMSPQELEKTFRIYKAKESERHKELKHAIANKLRMDANVFPESIAVDDKLIIRDDEKRRPDVYCRYKDKELVFEIQLSDLSLRYILSRHEFYKKHGIYLIWILDNYDIQGQSTMERDIKYLARHQNFFKFDETPSNALLYCHYKLPYLNRNNQLGSKWHEKGITLEELKFDEQEVQVYFFDFETRNESLSKLQERKQAEIEEAEQKRIEEERYHAALMKARKIKAKIKEYKTKDYLFFSIEEELKTLSRYEVEVLNKELGLQAKTHDNLPVLNYYIRTATKREAGFVQFLVSSKEIWLDIHGKDINGTTVLEEILNNEEITYFERYLVESLFKSGYKATPEECRKAATALNDEDTFIELDTAIFTYATKLDSRSVLESLFKSKYVISVIESAKQGKMIGFRYKDNQWIAFANNAISHYKEYWDYIEAAFKHYNLWNRIMAHDKKGTFHKKLKEFYGSVPEQNYEIDELFCEIYPELVNN